MRIFSKESYSLTSLRSAPNSFRDYIATVEYKYEPGILARLFGYKSSSSVCVYIGHISWRNVSSGYEPNYWIRNWLYNEAEAMNVRIKYSSILNKENE